MNDFKINGNGQALEQDEPHLGEIQSGLDWENKLFSGVPIRGRYIVAPGVNQFHPNCYDQIFQSLPRSM